MKIKILSAVLLVAGGAPFVAAQQARQLWYMDGREPKTQPSSAAAGSAAFTLTITGTGFANGASVLWNNQALTTTFVNASQLTAKVPAALVASPGTASITVAGSGVTSPPAAFTINPAQAVQAKAGIPPKPKATKGEPRHEELAHSGAPNSRPNSALIAQPVVFAQAAKQPLGIRYSLLRVVEGRLEEASPDSTFHSGDWVKVKVEGNRDGFLYVVSRGSGGNWNVLFPSVLEAGDNSLKARREYQIPGGKQAFHFDEQVGQERLFIVYSSQPVEDLDALIYSLRKPDRTDAPGNRMMAQNSLVSDGLVARLRDIHSRDLIIDRMPASDKAEAKAENAVYVVNGTGGRVVADITLKHE